MPRERIWYEDLRSFLFNSETLTKFIPDAKYTLVENLNALMRFSIYLTAIVLLIKRDVNAIAFVLVMAIVTGLIHHQDTTTQKTQRELFDRLNVRNAAAATGALKPCYKPSKNNPFMNVSFADWAEFPSRPEACDITRKSVKKEVNSLFEDGLHRDTDDIYSRKASDRQFYTMPVTTIPNDQTGFAEWLYKPKETCKERTLRCMP